MLAARDPDGFETRGVAVFTACFASLPARA
jgi:hypothetical protein